MITRWRHVLNTALVFLVWFTLDHLSHFATWATFTWCAIMVVASGFLVMVFVEARANYTSLYPKRLRGAYQAAMVLFVSGTASADTRISAEGKYCFGFHFAAEPGRSSFSRLRCLSWHKHQLILDVFRPCLNRHRPNTALHLTPPPPCPVRGRVAVRAVPPVSAPVRLHI